MDIEKLEIDLIGIIKKGLREVNSMNLKSDNSIVTNCDIYIEEKI